MCCAIVRLYVGLVTIAPFDAGDAADNLVCCFQAGGSTVAVQAVALLTKKTPWMKIALDVCWFWLYVVRLKANLGVESH